MTVEQLRKCILGAVIATALLASSCTSAAVSATQYPDVDPGPDVDIIGDAASMSR
jgi:hypothetical protein